ncbi:MAG: SpoIIIAH-like family protein [Eubacteriales bacterium]|jgi:stage III sporulation protein AH
MNFDEVKKKIKEYDWKKFLTSRNFVIVCCVLILGAAIVVYSAVAQGSKSKAAQGDKTLGNVVLVGNENPATETETDADGDGVFAVSVINRERTRGEAMEVLQTIAASPDAMPDAKEGALLSIAAMVADMNAEANIEMLVKSKGFEECVALVSGNMCSVIVKTDGLLPDEVAQILEIATEQTGISAEVIKIIPKKG